MCVLVSRWASPTATNVTVTLVLQILYDAIHLLLHPEVCILELFYSALQLVVCILELFYSTLELLCILSWGRWGRSPKRWGRPHAKSFYIARSRLKNHHRYLPSVKGCASGVLQCSSCTLNISCYHFKK